tara:strand:- start:1037 stop:2038 length:1002 start_codon:yes stop_codon:yes gene_type:complete
MAKATVMRCIGISEYGGIDKLALIKRPIPIPKATQILIETVGIGVNRSDIYQRLGQYPAPSGASDIMGLEVSGYVRAVGSDVTEWTIGEPVCALLDGGGYAEYAIAEEGCCMPVPNGVLLTEAATLPETVLTVWHNIFQRGNIKSGDSVLIHGGASGIGTTAIQLCKAFNTEVIVTAGSDKKCKACLELGADMAINYKTEDFQEKIRTKSSKGVDLILDMVGGHYIQKNIKCLRPDGTLLFIGFLDRSKAEVDFMSVMLKRITITGSTLRSRPLDIKTQLRNEVVSKVWDKVEAGFVKPIVNKIFPLEMAAEAHKLMEENEQIGKILLVPKFT